MDQIAECIFPIMVSRAKDRQKKKRGTKGILLNDEGDASLEDLTETGLHGSTQEATPEQGINNKKRKSNPEKQNSLKPRSVQKVSRSTDSSLNGMSESNLADDDLEEPPNRNADLEQQKPKRAKRPKKSVNENLEPAFTAATRSVPEVSGIMISTLPV